MHDGAARIPHRSAGRPRLRGWLPIPLAICAALSLAIAPAEAEDAETARAMRLFDESRYEEALPLLTSAAARRDPTALQLLGLFYDRGLVVAQDYERAHEYYSMAAELGDAVALNNLGVMYLDGLGVRTDYGRALQLFEQAHGRNAWATYHLGIMYRDGKGVSTNYADAVWLFAQASWRGHPSASSQITPLLRHLSAFTVTGETVNVRMEPNAKAEIIDTLPRGTEVYHLALSDGWRQIYARKGDMVGFISDGLLRPARSQAATPLDRFPARPQRRAGVISCNTNCWNGDCYRTYDDGRKVRFQARMNFNPFTNQMEWDSGPC